MSCASGCAGLPPMMGGGKKKRTTKYVKKGGTITNVEIDSIFRGIDNTPRPRLTRGSIKSDYSLTKYRNIDKLHFKEMVDNVKDQNAIQESQKYDWTITIKPINQDKMTVISIGVNGKVSIPESIFIMSDMELLDLSLKDIEYIQVNDIKIFRSKYFNKKYNKNFLQVPFYVIVMLKVIKMAVLNGLCSTTECVSPAGIPLHTFFIKFLNSKLVQNHMAYIKKLTETPLDIDSLTNLLASIDTKAKILEKVKEKIANLVDGNVNIMNYGPQIEIIIDLVMRSPALEDAEKSGILSVLDEYIVNLSRNYMANKTRTPLYGRIYLMRDIPEMRRHQEFGQIPSNYEKEYNDIKEQLERRPEPEPEQPQSNNNNNNANANANANAPMSEGGKKRILKKNKTKK
jgi:hypothetical protein